MFIKPVSKSLFLFLLLVATACGAQKSSAVADLRKTVQVVSKGMEALGSAAPWVSVRTLSIDYIGCKDLDGQCHAFGVVPVSLHFQNAVYADFRNDRLINETQDRYLGGCLFHFRAVYSDSAAFSYEVPRMRFSGVTDLPLTTRGSTRQTLLHHIPAYVVKAALEKKLSLRFAGRVQEREKVLEVVSFPYTPTLTLDLYFDTATHLLEKYRFFTDQLIHGDQEVEYRYPAYDRVHGLLFLSQKKDLHQRQSLACRSLEKH